MSRSSDQIGKIKKTKKKLDIEYFLISVKCSLKIEYVPNKFRKLSHSFRGYSFYFMKMKQCFTYPYQRNLYKELRLIRYWPL